MATSSARPSSTRDDRELTTLAVAGDGDAFALLYDRHERRVFGFCLRMLGNPDDAADTTQETFMRLLGRLPALEGRDVNFIAYVLTTARNACYDTIAARRRVEPVAEQLDRSTMTGIGAPVGQPGAEAGDVTRDPERAALLAAAREDVRAANARLPERQREVLALRELEQLSYGQIGEIVGLNENAVAQLISRARIRLRDLIRGDALESIATSSLDCERALPLLARQQDDQHSSAEELDWLRTHVAACDTCRSRRATMEEAGASYRALGPIVPLTWLRHTTIARAAQLVGADWSHVAEGSGPGTHPSEAPPAGTRVQDGTHVGASIDAGVGTGAGQDGGGTWLGAFSRRMRSSGGSQRSGEHRLRWLIVAVGLCVTLAVVVLVGSITPDGRVLPQSDRSTATPVTTLHIGGGSRIHAVGRADHTRAPASGLVSRAHGPALAIVAGGGAQASDPVPVVRHDRRQSTPRRHTVPSTTEHRSAPKGSSTPTGGAPSAQPTTTTTTSSPTTTTPAPSGESSGGGSPTMTTPTETVPGGSPGGSTGTSTEPEHGCALAIACH